MPQTSGESRFSLAPGPHNLEASAPGYQTHTTSIKIQSNRTVTEHLDLEKERPPSITTKTITKDSETPETSSDIASNLYLSIGVGLEALSSPVKNKPEATANNPAYVETQSDSKGPKLSPTFDIEIGLNQGFGVFYSGAVIPETSDSTATDGYDPMVVEANRKRFRGHSQLSADPRKFVSNWCPVRSHECRGDFNILVWFVLVWQCSKNTNSSPDQWSGPLLWLGRHARGHSNLTQGWRHGLHL